MNNKKILIIFTLCCVLGVTLYYVFSDDSTQPDSENKYRDGVVIDSTDSFDEFSENISELIKQYDSEEIPDEANSNPYYSKRLIVRNQNDTKLDLSGYGAEAIICGTDNRYVLQFDSEEKAKAACQKIEKLENIDYCEPDGYAGICEDTSAPVSWGNEVIGADTYARHVAETVDAGKEITVAVVDTGVYKHSFLRSRFAGTGRNFVSYGEDADDDNSHGTHVAGIIVGCTPNLNVNILPVKVLGKNGKGSSIQIAMGIEYAAAHHADVINLSLGGDYSTIIDRAVNSAIEKGCIVVVAAGNENSDTSNYSPAHLENCIVVAAIDSKNKRQPKSNYGNSVDVAAPGVDIESCVPVGGRFGSQRKDGKKKMTGTSMAAPHISALAAMTLLEYPSKTPAEIEQMIKDSASDLGEEGWDQYFGWGVPNVSKGYEKTQLNIEEFENQFYKPILEEYKEAAKVNFETEFHYVNEGIINARGMGGYNLYYRLADLADDGVPELIIAFAYEENEEAKAIVDIYGVQDNRAVRMIENDGSVGYRNVYNVCKDKRIKQSWSGGAWLNGVNYFHAKPDGAELISEGQYIYDGEGNPPCYIDPNGNETEISEKEYENLLQDTDVDPGDDWKMFYSWENTEEPEPQETPEIKPSADIQAPVLGEWYWKESIHTYADGETYEITWDKVNGAEGYEVEYSEKNDGEEWGNGYTNTVQTNEERYTVEMSAMEIVLKIRVRSYVTVDGQIVYSDWSQEKVVNVVDLWNNSEPLYRR